MAKRDKSASTADPAKTGDAQVPKTPPAQPLSPVTSTGETPVPPASAVESQEGGPATISQPSEPGSNAGQAGQPEDNVVAGKTLNQPNENNGLNEPAETSAPQAPIQPDADTGTQAPATSDPGQGAGDGDGDDDIGATDEAAEPQFPVGREVEYFDPTYSHRRKTPVPRFPMPEPPVL